MLGKNTPTFGLYLNNPCFFMGKFWDLWEAWRAANVSQVRN